MHKLIVWIINRSIGFLTPHKLDVCDDCGDAFVAATVIESCSFVVTFKLLKTWRVSPCQSEITKWWYKRFYCHHFKLIHLKCCNLHSMPLQFITTLMATILIIGCFYRIMKIFYVGNVSLGFVAFNSFRLQCKMEL